MNLVILWGWHCFHSMLRNKCIAGTEQFTKTNCMLLDTKCNSLSQTETFLGAIWFAKTSRGVAGNKMLHQDTNEVLLEIKHVHQNKLKCFGNKT